MNKIKVVVLVALLGQTHALKWWKKEKVAPAAPKKEEVCEVKEPEPEPAPAPQTCARRRIPWLTAVFGQDTK